MNADEKSSMKELEGWIEQLLECKQLSENQVGESRTAAREPGRGE